ncbi:hypothetical protein ACLBOM_25440 [Escherichia coli]
MAGVGRVQENKKPKGIPPIFASFSAADLLTTPLRNLLIFLGMTSSAEADRNSLRICYPINHLPRQLKFNRCHVIT